MLIAAIATVTRRASQANVARRPGTRASVYDEVPEAAATMVGIGRTQALLLGRRG